MGQYSRESELNIFKKEQLEEAVSAINSLVHKCEKAQEKVTHRTSQRTLLTNRIRALNIALALIIDELKKH